MSRRGLELVGVLLLSLTTVLTAWTGYQASRWGGATSIAFNQASATRVEASRLDSAADVRLSNHLGLWTQWVVATGSGDRALAGFIEDRFPPELRRAHQAWLAEGGPAAEADSPFSTAAYVLPERRGAARASRRADELVQRALLSNVRADDYTLLTVLFATVLFFVAMSGRVTALRSQLLLLALAGLLATSGIVLLVTFPRLL